MDALVSVGAAVHATEVLGMIRHTGPRVLEHLLDHDFLLTCVRQGTTDKWVSIISREWFQTESLHPV